MIADGFGRKQIHGSDGAAAPDSDPYAARRAAFLAAERSRRVQDTERNARAASEARAQVHAAARADLLPAYLLLLIAGPLGAHHWYLGANHLASKQLTMFLCGVGLCVAGGPAALFGLLFLLLPLSLWLTVDLFLIPAQCRSRKKANAASKEVAGVFS